MFLTADVIQLEGANASAEEVQDDLDECGSAQVYIFVVIKNCNCVISR